MADKTSRDVMPASFQISRQLDQEKIDQLTRRVENLLRSNNEIRTSSSANERDTHDIVLYFQREMEIKDDIILKLNEELVKCQTQLKFEVEKIRKSFESEIGELRENNDYTISELRMKLIKAEDDLKAVDTFRQEKETHEGVVKNLERQMMDQRKQLIDAMEEQERRFLEEKSRQFKDLEEQKTAFREIALNEAKSTMGEEAKKIVADNHRMFEELKFHHAEYANIQTEKNNMAMDLASSRREVSIFAEKEIEYAKQAYGRSKEIKILRERIDTLEKQQSVNIERFKVRAKELKSTVTRELEEATLDAAGLRRLIQIKNKELKHMKSLAATILNQRSETEQFFLESLQEVKEVITKERTKAQQEEKAAILAGLNIKKPNREVSGKTTFPALKIKGLNNQMPAKSIREIDGEQLEKLSIKDLTWEDKELVLRVLFSKMNGSNQQTVTGGGGSIQHTKSRSKRTGARPVFVSEGAYGDPNVMAEAEQYQHDNFEVQSQYSNNTSRTGTANSDASGLFRSEF